MRGLSEPNGSWKTICSSRRSGRIALKDSLLMSRPLKLDASAATRSCRASARPSVVLPEPDSPTTPSVWPARTVTSMPSTAFTWSTVLRKKPCLIGNQTLMSWPSITVLARRVGRRRLALRLGGEQMARIVVLRIGEDLLGRPGLDDLALGHHADPVGDLAHDAEVMGDEQHRHALAWPSARPAVRGSAPAR